jgi:hypothetical protein
MITPLWHMSLAGFMHKKDSACRLIDCQKSIQYLRPNKPRFQSMTKSFEPNLTPNTSNMSNGETVPGSDQVQDPACNRFSDSPTHLHDAHKHAILKSYLWEHHYFSQELPFGLSSAGCSTKTSRAASPVQCEEQSDCTGNARLAEKAAGNDRRDRDAAATTAARGLCAVKPPTADSGTELSKDTLKSGRV